MKHFAYLFLASACTFSRPADVTFGDAAITITAGDGQTAIAGAELPEALIVNVTDADFLPIENFTVEYAVTVGNGVLSGDSVRTDAQGNARIRFTVGQLAGANEIDVTGEGISTDRVFFAATGLVGPAVRLAAVEGDGDTATVAETLTVATRLEDQYGNGVVGVAIDHAVASGGGALSSGSGTTDDAGIVRTQLTLGTVAGPQTVTASTPGMDTLVHTISAAAGAPATMSIVGPATQTGDALRPMEIAAIVRDQYNNPTAGGEVAFTRTTGTGVLSAATATSGADGRAVITVTHSTMGSSSALQLAFGAGAPLPLTVRARTFASAQNVTTTTHVARSVLTPDINKDGRADLVWLVPANSSFGTRVAVALSTTTTTATTATFATPVMFAVSAPSQQLTRLAAGDLDNDGAIDLVVAGSDLRVLRNQTATGGTVASFADYLTVAVAPGSGDIEVVELTGDQLPEIVSSDFVTLHNGGGFAFTRFTGPNSSNGKLASGDLDGDGKIDLVSATSSTYFVGRNATAATPSFLGSTTQTGSTGQVTAINVFDVDGDGKRDLVSSHRNGSSVQISVRLATATVLAFANAVSLQGTESARSADLNGDGKPDLIGTNYGYPTSLLPLLNTSTVGAVTVSAQPTVALPNSYYAETKVLVGDFDGDQRPDTLVENASTNNTLYVYLQR